MILYLCELFYLMIDLFEFLIFDCFSLLKRYIEAIKVEKYAVSSIFYLTFAKLGVIYLTLILPIMILDVPDSIVIGGFLIGYLTAEAILSLTFQVTHVCDFSKFEVVNV